jgi:hypothetical protein
MNEYGQVIDKGTVRFERLLPGPVERVWQYLTDSQLRGTWLATGPMEPRAGGASERAGRRRSNSHAPSALVGSMCENATRSSRPFLTMSTAHQSAIVGTAIAATRALESSASLMGFTREVETPAACKLSTLGCCPSAVSKIPCSCGQIAAAIRVIVQLSRLSDGKRKVTSIAEITGLEGDIIQMQEIFKFVRTGTSPDGTVIGHFQATGVRPRFLGDLVNMGIKIPGTYFDPSQPL